MWAPLQKALDGLRWHYTDVRLRRSDAQVEREKKLLFCAIPFNRWMIVPAAVLVQLCIGSLYSWSVYNVPIEKELGLPAGTAANTFYIAVGFFGFSAAALGPVLERRGPMVVLLCSSTMFWLGHMIAAIGAWQEVMGLIYFGYGVVAGIGFGVTYITPVSPLQKWFPDYKGLCSGLAVCGFGGGSIIASKAENKLIKEYGVALTFVILGTTYYIIMLLCAIVLRCPPPGYYVESPEERKKRQEHEEFLKQYGSKMGSQNLANTGSMAAIASNAKKAEAGASDIPAGVYDVHAANEPEVSAGGIPLQEPEMKFTLLQGLFNRDYALMYITLMTNSVAGLMIMSKMADIMQQQFKQSADFASNIVMINAGFNMLGRLTYGALSDKIGQKPIFVTSLFCQAIIMGVLPTLIHENLMWVFIVLIWILAMFYGAGFGLMPAFLTAMFGSQNIGALHGIILTGWSMVGIVGGLTFTAMYKDNVAEYAAEGGKANPHVYDDNFYAICAVICVGFFVALLIRTSMRDRMTPRQPGELLRVPCFGRPIVFGYKTKEQQNAEWANYLRSLPQNQPNGQSTAVNMASDTQMA